MDCSPPSSTARGIFQARIPEWVVISFSRISSWPKDLTRVSCIGRWLLYCWTTWQVRSYWTKCQTLRAFSDVQIFMFSACMHVCSVMSDSLQPHGLQPTRLPCPGNFTGKNTGVGCHFLHQGVFPTQGLDLSLPHCRRRLYCWAIRVAFMFSCNYKVLDCKPFKITVLADLYTLNFSIRILKIRKWCPLKSDSLSRKNLLSSHCHCHWEKPCAIWICNCPCMRNAGKWRCLFQETWWCGSWIQRNLDLYLTIPYPEEESLL